ncbi:MAG: NAD(P)H-hydrate epimerase [Candidatus Marinimicrobia bacterium]|nr:NAD(P)H-hydrate epimerase [Candidatus Neomarinimicrobiota bacterium]
MNKTKIPSISTEQMRKVDDLMINKYGIELIQMMENAGANLAKLTINLMDNNFEIPNPKNVIVACGLGNNGGGGMVAARHLSNHGFNITVVLTGAEAKLKSIPLKQWNILKKLPVRMIIANSSDTLGVFNDTDLIIDAIIGYGMHGELKGIPAHVIHEILNSQNQNVLSLDAPSGLNTTTGDFNEKLCIRAYATMTLALPKMGLVQDNAKECVGELYVADIGVPPDLYKEVGYESQYLFADTSIIKVN